MIGKLCVGGTIDNLVLSDKLCEKTSLKALCDWDNR